MLLLLLAAQLQIGSIRGTVVDPSGGAIRAARIILQDGGSALERVAVTDEGSSFLFRNLPYGLYDLRVEASGFRTHSESIRIRSNLTAELAITLELSGTEEQVTVRAADDVEASSAIRLGETFVERFPGSGGGLQQLVATAPGWATEDNGLLHSRGVDDGFLFVVGGIPWSDRVDRFFASAIDTEAFHSLEILDGHLPVEYGYASGGVINIVPRSGLSRSWAGTTGARIASEESAEASFTAGGVLAEDAGLFVAGSYGGSGERYLDPVDPENFNNSGSALRLTSRLDWRPAANDLLIVDLSANGSGFRVTNTLEQELAGQRQREELRDDHQSVVWQRSWSRETVTDLAWYRHSFGARLLPSERDTPISAGQDRGHVRQGALLNVTHQAGEHVLKAGLDFQRVSVRERFSFFVTGDGDGEAISPPALEHGPEDPFLFEDRERRHLGSGYVQDTFSPFDGVVLNAGIRFDWTTLLVRDRLPSPRIGVAYRVPGLGATVRGSYNRLFKAPQVENLLLSSSEEARALSPFDSGGAEVFPERQHAFEAGFSRTLAGWVLLDAAYWRREVRNYADPNVFFGTTIIFPNSVAEGTASGVNVRLDFPFRRGVSGFLSYGNSLVRQTGPINGGLFLEDEILEIGPGTTFIPDHDQRNVGAFGFTYHHRENGLWASVYGRHESGTPLEVEEDEIDEVMERRGAELVDFDRMRVKPRTLFDVSAGIGFFRERRVGVDLQLDVRNLTGAAFAYNFSNPFSGTHFGHPRLFSVRVKLSFW
ncbi:MAG: TonB-dependent receptor [Vicinamibacteria bacterium]